MGAQQGQVQALTPDGTDPPTASFTLTALPENAKIAKEAYEYFGEKEKK